MPESVTRTWEMFVNYTSHLSTLELILRVALIGCSLFATIQLLSMMGTHYGDRNATSKSLFLSLLLHCCFGLGWVTAVDSMLPLAGSTGPSETTVKPVPVMLVSTDETAARSGESARTAWNGSTERPQLEATRLQRTEQDLVTEQPIPDRTPAPLPAMPEETALPTQPDEPIPTPAAQSVDSPGSMVPARQTADIDQPVLEARAEAVSVAAAPRQQVKREASTIDVATRVEPQRGAAERTAPLIEDGAVLTLPNELKTDTTVPIPAGMPDLSIKRRSSPTPVPADEPATGNDPSSAAATATGDRRSSRFSRSGSKNGAEIGFEPAPANRPKTATPGLSTEPIIASRASTGPFTTSNPRPELSRPDSSTITSKTPTRDPETYRSRRIEQRQGVAIRNGGSVESERAVEASLKWMASVQESDGSWSAAKYGGGAAKKDPQGQNRLDGGMHADTGITGLVVLSFLGAGYTHEEGQYADVVMRALKWLIAQQNSNGYLGGQATRYDMMYCHAMATFALAEAYGMQSNANSFPELGDAVRGGVRLICAMQNEDGGWRYGKGGESDMSMFGWQLMALKSAVNAGVPVPDDTRRGMTKFLQARALGSRGGLAGYKANEPPTPAMTAEALFCRQMFGVRPGEAASQESVAYLRQNLPRLGAYDEYYWYYGTLAMFQHDGQPWEEWNGSLRDMLIRQQRTQGANAGSWDPNGKWAGIGGRLYSTAVSTMCLEVYYRFLRIYQTGDQ